MELKNISSKVKRQRIWEQIRMGNKKYIRKRFSGLSCDPGKDTHGLSLSGVQETCTKPRIQVLSEALHTFF